MANSILAKMAVLISANTAAFDKNLKQSESQFARFTNTLSQGAKTVGGVLGAMQIYSGLKYGIGVMADFEHRMSEVKAITGASGKDFEALRKNALDLGKSTKYTAEQVGELQVAYGRLGFTNKEILQVTKSTLDLASATGEDLAKSADIAGSTLRGFGLDASQMERVIDVMASSFNKSALGLENFSEAMKYVAPVAAANNISLEETTALLGTLADNGIRGSMAGTSLRKIISDLDKGSKPLNEKLADLAAKGFNSADAMDEVGRTAYAALLTLVKYTGKTDALTEALRNANGEATKQSSIMQDDLTGDFTKLTSAVDGLILSFDKSISPMRDVVQIMTEFVNLLSTDEGVSFINNVVTQLTYQIQILYRIAKALNKEIDKGAKNGYDQKKIDEEIIEQIWGKKDGSGVKPSKDWNPFGSFFDQIGTQVPEATNKLIITIEALEKKRDELVKQFEQTDVTDKKKLVNIGNEIKAIEAQIAKYDELRRKQAGSKGEKFQFIYDAEAEGSTNPELRNEQAINEQKEFAAALKEVATSAEFAGQGLIKLDGIAGNITSNTERWTAQIADYTGAIASSISGIANSLGELMAGTNAEYEQAKNALANAKAGTEEYAEALARVEETRPNFGKSMIKVLLDFGRQVGEILIGIGTAMLAARKAITNPYTAIAAGIALVALSGALSASLAASQQQFNSGGGSLSSKATENATSSKLEMRELKERIELGHIDIQGDTLRLFLRTGDDKSSSRRGRV